MQVRFKPETESRLNELAAKTGRSPADLIEDAMAGYLVEVAETRNMLATRCIDIKSGRVKPIDSEEAFSRLASKTSQSPKCN
jgi:predicted DNA-binding protein